MNSKLTATIIAFAIASSLVLAQDAPDTRYYPATSVASGQPDAKDMKGMSQLAPPPPPAPTHFYVSAYGGAQFITSYGDNRQAVNPTPYFGEKNTTSTTIHSNYGGVGGIKFGYMFDPVPICDWSGFCLQPVVEAEALYIGDNSHAADFAGYGSNENFSSNSADFFVNGILRFPNKSIVTPYFGAGVGLQYLTTHGTFWSNTSHTTFVGQIALFPVTTTTNQMITGVDTSDLDFAAQALAGVEFRLCEHVSLTTEYKFIDAIGNDGHSDNFPLDNTYRLQPDQIMQHLITAGVKYDF